MGTNTASNLAPETPEAPASARDADYALRHAESQLLSALIQINANDHAERANQALGAISLLDHAQTIVDRLTLADDPMGRSARIASTRARVYDTARRILEDGGSFDPALPPEAWQESRDQALRWRRRVTEIAPEQPTGWLDLGIALQTADSGGSEAALRKAVELDPNGAVGKAAERYLDGSIASGRMDSIPGLPRPAPKEEPRERTPKPAPQIEDPRTERRRRKYLGSIELLAATESATRSDLERMRQAATSAPDSPEVARAIADGWVNHATALRSRKELEAAGQALLEARAVCPTLEGIEEQIVAVDKERASRADRKVRLIALLLGVAVAAFVVFWQVTHHVPKD